MLLKFRSQTHRYFYSILLLSQIFKVLKNRRWVSWNVSISELWSKISFITLFTTWSLDTRILFCKAHEMVISTLTKCLFLMNLALPIPIEAESSPWEITFIGCKLNVKVPRFPWPLCCFDICIK